MKNKYLVQWNKFKKNEELGVDLPPDIEYSKPVTTKETAEKGSEYNISFAKAKEMVEKGSEEMVEKGSATSYEQSEREETQPVIKFELGVARTSKGEVYYNLDKQSDNSEDIQLNLPTPTSENKRYLQGTIGDLKQAIKEGKQCFAYFTYVDKPSDAKVSKTKNGLDITDYLKVGKNEKIQTEGGLIIDFNNIKDTIVCAGNGALALVRAAGIQKAYLEQNTDFLKSIKIEIGKAETDKEKKFVGTEFFEIELKINRTAKFKFMNFAFELNLFECDNSIQDNLKKQFKNQKLRVFSEAAGTPKVINGKIEGTWKNLYEIMEGNTFGSDERKEKIIQFVQSNIYSIHAFLLEGKGEEFNYKQMSDSEIKKHLDNFTNAKDKNASFKLFLNDVMELYQENFKTFVQKKLGITDDDFKELPIGSEIKKVVNSYSKFEAKVSDLVGTTERSSQTVSTVSKPKVTNLETKMNIGETGYRPTNLTPDKIDDSFRYVKKFNNFRF